MTPDGGYYTQSVSYENYPGVFYHCRDFTHRWDTCKVLIEKDGKKALNVGVVSDGGDENRAVLAKEVGQVVGPKVGGIKGCSNAQKTNFSPTDGGVSKEGSPAHTRQIPVAIPLLSPVLPSPLECSVSASSLGLQGGLACGSSTSQGNVTSHGVEPLKIPRTVYKRSLKPVNSPLFSPVLDSPLSTQNKGGKGGSLGIPTDESGLPDNLNDLPCDLAGSFEDNKVNTIRKKSVEEEEEKGVTRRGGPHSSLLPI